jgi:hypothetical protein
MNQKYLAALMALEVSRANVQLTIIIQCLGSLEIQLDRNSTS